MKKLLVLFSMIAILFSCEKNEEMIYGNKNKATGEPVVLTGYSSIETRTHFGTPGTSSIPYFWSKGDYIWWGSFKSNAIDSDCGQAQFTFKEAPSSVGAAHIFYNMTGQNKTANVLSEQTADGNLGNDGDFGYAQADEFGAFYLSHKTSYLWFNTTSEGNLPKLVSITAKAEGVSLAGKSVYDYSKNEWSGTVTNGSDEIVLDFGEGVELKSDNGNNIFATMVTLPAAIKGKKLTLTYTFEDGSTFTKERNITKNFEPGATNRISDKISSSNLVKPAPSYELRVLTFEDKDARFESYTLDYVNDFEGVEIRKWSDLIDEPMYMGPLTYGNDQMDAVYYWYDEGNTELTHTFPDNNAYCFWGGGHAISNYVGEGFDDEYRDKHIAKYYGQSYVDTWAGQPGADAFLGWFNLQMMIPVPAHSGNNFVVHYGYKDFFTYIENLPEISFADGEARVIDHMYVVNTNYTLNQLVNGVKSEEGNTFGGNWEGLTEDAWLKIVAYGFDDVDADADAEPISEAEFYLVNGENVVTEWQKWDLSGLGKVAKVRFNFLYSEEMGGRYGFTIPGYFAYDDVAVRFEK